MSRIRTCLWFDQRGEEAARFYVDLVPNSRVESMLRPEPDGVALLVDFTLDGVPYQALNGGPQFPQTEAASIVLLTESQAETDRYWEALVADGGRESRCGWLKDRFGVSWQVVPRRAIELFQDPTVGGRVMAALHPMTKIELAALEAAARG